MVAPDISNVTGTAGRGDIWSLYRRGGVLGKGAFGTVYEVEDLRNGEVFAVKQISKAKLACKEDVEDVRREMQVLELVGDHQNIAALKSAFEDRDYVYFILELCKGGELFDRIVAEGTFSERKAAQYFRIMVEVIHHCHQLGVIHRDIKPENFLLTSKDDDAELKAADFGLCTYFKMHEVFDSIVGSAYYVAPEVLRRNYTWHADMWSLGVILYILLSGMPPFYGDTEEAIFKMILRGQVDLVTPPWPEISAPAKDLVLKLLNRDPSARLTAQQALNHPWLKEQGVASDKPMDSVVITRIQQFAANSRFKKAAISVMASCLTPAELSGLEHLFQSIDADGNGTITAVELKQALQSMGSKIPDTELQALMEAADQNGDGTIDWQEFVAATIHMGKLENEDAVARAFKHFDRDNSGTITDDEVAVVLKDQGLSPEDISALIAEHDSNKDGVIDYQEFLAMMRNQGPLAQQLENCGSGRLAKSRAVSRRAKAKSLLSNMFKSK
jgi:calcium-dependent protein kinase